MKPTWLRVLPFAAVAAVGWSSVASSQSMNELIAAAKSEGELTVIALPRDWCNYGAVIDGFKATYRPEGERAQPRRRLRRRGRGDQGQ